MVSSTRAALQRSLGGGSPSNHRTALLLVALALTQVVFGGIGLVDGRTLLTLLTDPSGRSAPPSSQYLLDSPLPIAVGHVVGVRSIVGVAALSILFAAAPLLVFAALRLTQRLTTPQALSVASAIVIKSCNVNPGNSALRYPRTAPTMSANSHNMRILLD